MKRIIVLISACVVALAADASWYWPFGSDDGAAHEPRLSELMEPATDLIDEAMDLAADGKVPEAVEKYRKALLELDRIEAENPERAKSQEFASVRNKRAYVNAAIDTLLLDQVRSNAKSVAVSDTAQLEARLKKEREGEKKVEVGKVEVEGKAEAEKAEAEKKAEKKKDDGMAVARREAKAAFARGEFDIALDVIEEILKKVPNDVTSLNLKAAILSEKGDNKAAVATLEAAIAANPKNHFAYYNMALIKLKIDAKGNAKAARGYYEEGRKAGGPKDEELEGLLK